MVTQLPSNAAEPTVLLFETSPDGSLDAIVQQDERTVYLYLNSRDGSFGTRACWVRNLIEAPVELSKADLEQGIPPVLSRFVVNHPGGTPAPNGTDLRIVWFEEGNSIALFEKDALLAVIPPWSGRESFHGYARDCLAENEICWPLPLTPALAERIRRADDFWESWKIGNPFALVQESLLTRLRRRFGQEVQAYEVDREHWPPLKLVQFQSDQGIRLVSVGMSVRPQPNVELSESRPAGQRRIELGLEIRPGTPWDLPQAVELLAGQARFPWRKWTWLGHGHTARLNRTVGDPLDLLFVSERAQLGELIRFRDDPVHLLWMVSLQTDETGRCATDVESVIRDCLGSGRLQL